MDENKCENCGGEMDELDVCTSCGMTSSEAENMGSDRDVDDGELELGPDDMDDDDDMDDMDDDE